LKPGFERLSQKLSFPFKNVGLLELAFTHRSMGLPNNERLEFLGDAILGMVIAKALYDRLPKAKEGQLSRIRSSLVRRETLAKKARNLMFGDYLLLGPGELKSGGFNRDSILADSVEAVIGAISEDQGYEAAERFIHETFAEELTNSECLIANKDDKSKLQEWLQGKQLALPEYDVLSTDGDQHSQTFTVSCCISSCSLTVEATGSSRRIAEQIAARKALEQLL
jgi:ribonuclease III